MNRSRRNPNRKNKSVIKNRKDLNESYNTTDYQHVFFTINKKNKICDFSTGHENFNEYVRDKVVNMDKSRPVPLNFLVHIVFPKDWYLKMQKQMPLETFKNEIHLIGAKAGYNPDKLVAFRKAVFCIRNNLDYAKTLNSRETKDYLTFIENQMDGQPAQKIKMEDAPERKRIVVCAACSPPKKNHLKIR